MRKIKKLFNTMKKNIKENTNLMLPSGMQPVKF